VKEGIDGVVAWSGMLPEDPPLSPLATGTPLPAAAALWQDSPGAAAGMLEYFYRDDSGSKFEFFCLAVKFPRFRRYMALSRPIWRYLWCVLGQNGPP
jgi:hypothetical protein